MPSHKKQKKKRGRKKRAPDREPALDQVTLFLFVQQRRWRGWGGGLDLAAEPRGSNPILARYTLSPVNHHRVLGVWQDGDQESRRASSSASRDEAA